MRTFSDFQTLVSTHVSTRIPSPLALVRDFFLLHLRISPALENYQAGAAPCQLCPLKKETAQVRLPMHSSILPKASSMLLHAQHAFARHHSSPGLSSPCLHCSACCHPMGLSLHCTCPLARHQPGPQVWCSLLKRNRLSS
jgi:hypothetical protein